MISYDNGFDNHLNPFNEELAKNLDKNGKPVFSEITTYGDFFTGHPGEMKVIETCGAANIISGGYGTIFASISANEMIMLTGVSQRPVRKNQTLI